MVKSLEDLVLDIYSRKDNEGLRGRLEDIYSGKDKENERLRDRLEDDHIKKIEYSILPEIYKNNNLESKLEKIIKNDLFYKNSNYIEESYEGIINYNSQINENKKIKYVSEPDELYSILSNYISEGYEVTKKERKKKPEISHEELERYLKQKQTSPQQTQEVTARPLETTAQEMPAEYAPLFAMLAQDHPGIKYTGMITLADKSQHNVDILAFEYEENGELKQLHVVAKDQDEKEEVIPQFLNDLGIKTHSIYDRNTRLLIEHVGQRELRDVIRQGSESDIRKACAQALDKISQIHVLASLHLPELREKYGLTLELTDYQAQFKSRFLMPVSGNSVIISPQMNRLMQAYFAFTKPFDPRHFVHGDFHVGNCRLSEEECFIIDYEWARIGRKFDDLSRFTNSVIRDRYDIDATDFSREILQTYVEKHNEHSEEQRAPLLLPNERLASALRYSLINDEIYKVGEYILFGQTHPKVKEEKMQKSQACFERAINMLDGAIELADAQRNYYEWEALSNLRGALMDYVATSPVKALKETAEKYKAGHVKESLVLVPAA